MSASNIRFLGLVLIFFSLLYRPLAAQTQEETAQYDRARYDMGISKVREQLQNFNKAQSEASPEHIGLYLLSGYFVSTGLAAILGLGNGTSWLFFAASGLVAGGVGFAIKEQSTQGMFRKIKVLRQVESLMQQSLNLSDKEKIIELILEVSQVYSDLLRSERLGTSLEQWFYVSFSESVFKFLNQEYSDRKEEVFKEILHTLHNIKQQQRDVHLILRSLALYKKFVGAVGYLLKKRDWNDYKAWIQSLEGMDENEIHKLIDKYEEGRHELSKENLPKEIEVALLDANTQFKAQLELSTNPKKLTIFLRREEYDQLKEGILQHIETGNFAKILGEGLWIQIPSLSKKFWFFYPLDAELPYSNKRALGKMEVTPNIFSGSVQSVMLQPRDVAITVKELMRQIPEFSSPTWSEKVIGALGNCRALIRGLTLG